ncbi:hypothetical protein PLESTB_001307700 [Pleodorina starrii]|uniref:F-box domain-containing protein n=1 Tax=Pleodorina starrii TaxID=330485 RepID=A0A9W6F6E0_9CHLO|nr:hypothetical protein PLESTM_002047400 [Pleodorina starrii]GLC58004.1 hypothetical protein PLESTB_001307700 [Pleodorina starrii]GLC69603.1 hypothetical protein PLESTF_000853200 [Pleodorina starrii]
MPRLRLRVAATGATFKLELSQTCTWEGLQAEARRVTGLPTDEDVTLSLNKKVPLDGSPDALLSTLGVCNGDLVWLLSPEVAPAPEPPPAAADSQPPTRAPAPPALSAGTAPQSQPQPQLPIAHNPPPSAIPMQPTPTETLAPASNGGPVTSTEPQSLQDAAAPPAAAAAAAGQHPAAGGSDGGGGGGSDGGRAPMDVDERVESGARVEAGEDGDGPSGGEEAADREDAEQAAFPGVRGVSLKLLRLLAPNTAAGAATGSGGSGAAAAATSSSSPSSSPSSWSGCAWTSLSPAGRCLLVLDCAMSEAGFEGLQDLPSLAAQGGALPRQLLYGCSYIAAASPGGTAPDGGGGGGGAAAASSSAGGGGADEPMAEAGGGGGGAAAAPPVAKLHWYGMGRYLVVHGVPCISGGNGGCLSSITLHIDLSEYGAAAAAPTPTAAASLESQLPPPPPLPPPPQGQQLLMLPSDPAGHWRRLKDELVLPLLAAACRATGAPPPLGLLVLPLELQLTVLRRLQARDLAALSGVCTALHRLASEDELWRPLYDTEFGPALPAADAALANTRGFKCVYGRRWRERAERLRRRQWFRPVPPVPMWGPPPMAPFIRPPYMPPGAIGGDYDRLPLPLLGAGGMGGIGGPPAILGPGRGWFRGRGGGGLTGGFPGLGRWPGPWSGGGGGGSGTGGGFF